MANLFFREEPFIPYLDSLPSLQVSNVTKTFFLHFAHWPNKLKCSRVAAGKHFELSEFNQNGCLEVSLFEKRPLTLLKNLRLYFKTICPNGVPYRVPLSVCGLLALPANFKLAWKKQYNNFKVCGTLRCPALRVARLLSFLTNIKLAWNTWQ
jgi:hypothetical protein